MYHIPPGKTWRPENVVNSLSRQGLEAHVQNEQVVVRLPVEELLNIDEFLNSKAAIKLERKLIGWITAKLTYCQHTLLGNLRLECEIESLKSPDAGPVYSSVNVALQNCGYVCGSERHIALMYCRGNELVASSFDRIDELQKRKEEHIVNHRFDQARSLLDEERSVRQQVEEIVRASIDAR